MPPPSPSGDVFRLVPSYEHRKLIERFTDISSPPQDATEYAAWLTAREHLRLLRSNAQEGELIIRAARTHAVVHTLAVREDELFPLNKRGLLSWTGTPPRSRAGYEWGGGRDDVWIADSRGASSATTLANGVPLVFERQLHGFGDDDGIYFDVLQEYAHVTDIHWRTNQRAYCCFDEHGDIEHVVSATTANTKNTVSLVSFRREQLEQYLAATNSVLVRIFDFTLIDLDSRPFGGWSEEPATEYLESDELFFRQKIDPDASWIHGIQIVRLSHPRHEIIQDIMFPARKHDNYVDFIVNDFRNRRIATVSTDPSATTNYFEAEGNSLPYEMSPAFFHSEVLTRYKSDRDKYRIGEEHRTIACRGGWSLRSYDVNEAGQVHAYIVDLRALPYREQQYWKTFNEKPKSGISTRALENDFRGDWTDITTPLQDLLAIVREWARTGVVWWKLRDESLLDRVNTPRTSSQDEWATACQGLASLVVEGFEVSAIRAELDARANPFDRDEKSLMLLERLLTAHGLMTAGARLDGLREVQEIRTRIASHARGSRASELSRDALNRHGTYAEHFESLCCVVTSELKAIEAAFTQRQPRASSDG